MTVLTYLGHACFLLETETAACLTDPWLDPQGAFLGAWRQLPPNDHCLRWVLEKVKSKPVLIYVTHEHEDHYDEETLRKLLPYAEALCIPNYENNFLKHLIEKNLGTTPILVAEDEEHEFHGIKFKIFIDESGINRDSAILLKAKNLSFFDGNDCKIFDRASWLRGRCGAIDIMSCQFSGANMYPVCYEKTPDEYKNISHQKKMRKFVAMRAFINDLKPKVFVPSAGPPIFPFPEHYQLNFETETIFPKWWDFQSYLEGIGDATKFVPLAVGGSVATDGKGGFNFDRLARKIGDEELRRTVSYYRNIDATISAPSIPPSEDVLAYFEKQMIKKIGVLREQSAVRLGCPLYFEVKTGNDRSVVYLIHPDRLLLEKAARESIAAPYYLHLTSVEAIGKLMLSGKGWGTYFLSFLFRNKHDPDVYDSVRNTFFVANDADELAFGLKKLTEFRDNNEYITLESSDGLSTVTCKRFCPHQGGDLKYARFDGRFVVCPRHQWRFDCENGGRADQSGDTIDAVIAKKVGTPA
jgi:UDP-MurNAc hydroxylase